MSVAPGSKNGCQAQLLRPGQATAGGNVYGVREGCHHQGKKIYSVEECNNNYDIIYNKNIWRLTCFTLMLSKINGTCLQI